jgi:hypothetical protein
MDGIVRHTRRIRVSPPGNMDNDLDYRVSGHGSRLCRAGSNDGREQEVPGVVKFPFVCVTH